MRKKIILTSLLFSTIIYSSAQKGDVIIGDSTIISNAQAMEAYNKAIEFYNAQNYNSALDFFNQAISLAPEFHQAYYNRGVIKLEKSNTDEAISDLNKAIQLNKETNATYYFMRGKALYLKMIFNLHRRP